MNKKIEFRNIYSRFKGLLGLGASDIISAVITSAFWLYITTIMDQGSHDWRTRRMARNDCKIEPINSMAMQPITTWRLTICVIMCDHPCGNGRTKMHVSHTHLSMPRTH